MKEKVIFTTALCLSTMTQMMAQNITGKVMNTKGGIIKVTSVGYKTVCKDCEGENVGIIKMEEDSNMLGEVVVKSSLPKTILKHGGMTTIVAGSVLEKAGTM